MRDADDAEIMKKRMYNFLMYTIQLLNNCIEYPFLNKSYPVASLIMQLITH
jgi:hypothetical protein